MKLGNRVKRFFGFSEPIEEETNAKIVKLFTPYVTQKDYDYYIETIKSNPNEDPDILVKCIREFSKFLLDSHVYSCVQSRKSGVLSMDWEINSGENKTPEAEFIEGVFKSLDIRKIISDALDAVLYGYKPMEIYWEYDSTNTYLVPSDIIGKPSWWFKFDGDSQMRFMKRNSYKGEIPPPMKIVMIQHNGTYDNPYGDAVLAKCYFPVTFKSSSMELWGIYLEKYGMPLIHATTESQNQSDIDALGTALSSLQRDGVMVTGEGISVTGIENSNKGGTENYETYIHFMNAEISKAILSQTLTTEQGDTGSYSMSQTHLQVRKDVLMSDAKMVEGFFNKVIEWIIDANFTEFTGYPKFILYKDLEIDMALAQRDQIIFAGGYCKPTEQYLKKYYSFKDGDLEMITSAAPVPPNQMQFAEKQDSNPLSDLSEQIIEKVMELVDKGEDYDDIKKSIVDLFPDIDTKEAENYLSQGIIVATSKGLYKGAK